MRRQRNKIRCLKDGIGEWIIEEEAVKEHILNGFRKLYSTDLEMSYRDSPVSKFSGSFLTEKERNWMGREVSDEDVKVGLCSLKSFKALGPDDLHAGFYHHFWVEVGRSICEEVKAIFKDGLVSDHLNETLVTLIPKCKSPESLNNYKPISLCNSIYKIASKILVERIRPYLNKLVSPFQTAFMPRRKGLDNVLVAQERCYAPDKKKGKEGYMAIKVDLEKAYDRMEWCFIHKVLQAYHFPQSLIRVIMSCVTSNKVSILFNGGKLEAFNPSRGLRQGDPLSPYIFILCMEYLGHLIEKKCMEGVWKPLQASRSNIGISHYFLWMILFSLQK